MGGCFGIDIKSSSISEEAGLLSVQNRRILTLERDPASDEQNKPKIVIVADSTPTKEQRIAARLFSSDTGRLFRKTDSDNLNGFTPGSEFDLNITSSPMWPSANGLTTEISPHPIRLVGDNSSSSDALNPEGSVVKRFSSLWSSGKSSIRFTARTSSGNPIEGRVLVDGDDSTLNGHLYQTLTSLENPNSGLTGNESYNFNIAGDNSSSTELFLNADSSSDVLVIHQEKEESPQCIPKTYNNGQESSSDQLFGDNFMVNETLAPNISSSFTEIHPPHLDNWELTGLSPPQQDVSIIICREQSVSPGIYSPVAPPILQQVASPPSMDIKMIAGTKRSDSSEIIRFNDVTTALIPQSVNSVDVDEKSLIITSFDGHKAQTKERPAMRGILLDDEFSLTDRIVEMPLIDQKPTVPVFHDGDSSTDPIDFGEDQIRDKQTNRTADEELSASDQIVFEIKETELNRPFVNDESSSDPIDFEGSIDNHMGEPFGVGSGINKRNKKNNVKDRWEQKQSNPSVPEFTVESSSEILFGGDTKHSALSAVI